MVPVIYIAYVITTCTLGLFVTFCFSLNSVLVVLYPNRSGEYISTEISIGTYDNSSKKNGYAVVINNFDFGGLQNSLPGGQTDSKRLEDTFRSLNFDGQIYENKPKDEMVSIFENCK